MPRPSTKHQITEARLALRKMADADAPPPGKGVTINILNVNLSIDCDPDAPVRPMWHLGRIE